MITDQQVKRLMSLMKKGLPLFAAAAKAGMSEPTARIPTSREATE